MHEDLGSSLSTHMRKKGRADGKRGRREKKQASSKYLPLRLLVSGCFEKLLSSCLGIND